MCGSTTRTLVCKAVPTPAFLLHIECRTPSSGAGAGELPGGGTRSSMSQAITSPSSGVDEELPPAKRPCQVGRCQCPRTYSTCSQHRRWTQPSIACGVLLLMVSTSSCSMATGVRPGADCDQGKGSTSVCWLAVHMGKWNGGVERWDTRPCASLEARHPAAAPVSKQRVCKVARDESREARRAPPSGCSASQAAMRPAAAAAARLSAAAPAAPHLRPSRHVLWASYGIIVQHSHEQRINPKVEANGRR